MCLVLNSYCFQLFTEFLKENYNGVQFDKKLCLSFYILWHFYFISSGIKCDICNKAFGRNDGLLRHIKEIHENPKKCEFCGKYFGRQETLKQHISDVHEKNRNHKCNYCDQAFGHKGMYIHNKIKFGHHYKSFDTFSTVR